MQKVTKKSIIFDRINYKKDGRKTPSFFVLFFTIATRLLFFTFSFCYATCNEKEKISIFIRYKNYEY